MVEEEKFNSITDLYKRVLPALQAKVTELKREKITKVDPMLIWEYCIEFFWKNKKDLRIHNIVSDIMNVDGLKLRAYANQKAAKEDEK